MATSTQDLDIGEDFKKLAQLNVPVKRAAYSDRTAWLMAILAELAYVPFDEEADHTLLSLAADLANLTSQDEIAERLTEFQGTMAGFRRVPGSDTDKNARLRAALKIGGFELVGDVLHRPETDTQGFVACRRDENGTGMVVISFRGTKQIRDWMTNLNIGIFPIKDPRNGTIIGNMHEGFHQAYRPVHDEILDRLKDQQDLPLYITGHSLGGALAVIATWYQSSERLAACYTFGAPRVGDHGLMDRFKTPIYRIVNGPDPVPMVPPSGFALDIIKASIKLIGKILPLWGWADWFTTRLLRVQRFRHYGDMRYLTLARPGPEGDYPKLRQEFSLSTLRRIWRFSITDSGARNRIDKYHEMARYRDKLRALALRRNR